MTRQMKRTLLVISTLLLLVASTARPIRVDARATAVVVAQTHGHARLRQRHWFLPHSVNEKARPSASPVVYHSGVPDWDATAYCESHDQWNINSGNGYWGGLQFAHSTWFSFGGGPFNGIGWFPYSRAEQITVAERVFAVEGAGAWPNCFAWK